MTSFQKVIKYLAICLAIFICITLFSGIVSGIKTLFESFNFIDDKDNSYSEVIDYNEEFKYLDISLKSSGLTIKTGDKFSVDTSDNNIKIYNKKGTLKIVDKRKSIFNIKSKKTIITIPYNYSFEKVKIETGTGKVDINGVYTNSLEMELGAGKASLNNIVSNKTHIETGIGSVNISNSKLNDLNLELGVGKVDIVAEVIGESSIEAGVGKLNLSLNLPLYEYTFELEKGFGEIKLNNRNIKKDSKIGEGSNRIKIEGGIGSIVINTSEK